MTTAQQHNASSTSTTPAASKRSHKKRDSAAKKASARKTPASEHPQSSPSPDPSLVGDSRGSSPSNESKSASPSSQIHAAADGDDDDDDDDAIHETSEWLEPAREDGLTLYDLHRRPRQFPSSTSGGTNDPTEKSDADRGTGMMRRPIQLVRSEFRCAICLETIRETRTVMECLHRFCALCLEESIRKNYKHCPVCRSFIPSRRCLAPDPNFDALVRKLLGPAATVTAASLTATAVAATDGDSTAKPPSNRTSPSDMGDDNDEVGRPLGAAIEVEPHSLQHAIHHKRLQQLHHHSRTSEDAVGGGAGWHPGPVSTPFGPHLAHPRQPLVAIELHKHPDEARLADLVLPHLRISESAPVRVIDTFLKLKLGLMVTSATDHEHQAGSTPKRRDREHRTHTTTASSSDAGLMLYLSTTDSKKRKVSGMETAAGRLLHLTDRKKNSLTLKDLQVRYQIQGTLHMFYKSAKA